MKASILIFTVSCLVAGPVPASGAQIAGGAVYAPGRGVSSPIAMKEVRPRYTAAAQNAKIQGLVRLECVVLPDGTVGDVRVIEPLDPGLDEEAITAVKQWRFKPGTKDGHAVAVRVSIDMTFTLGTSTEHPLLPLPPGTSFRSRQSSAVYTPGRGVSAPTPLKQVRPQYPAAVQKAEIQGLVTLECVVLPDGTVGDVRVIQPLDPGLDEEAIKAVKEWRFKPGTKGGQAVPVRVPIDMTFTLR